jgi:hypothetical protein
MIELTVDTTDILRIADEFIQAPGATNIAIAQGLNKFGGEVKAGMLEYLSVTTGLDQEAIESVTVVNEATPGSLVWQIDASQALVKNSEAWQRPWQIGSDTTFAQNVLLDIITQSDCCEVCSRAAQEGPYTAEQVSMIAAEWANFVPTGLSWLSALSRAPVTNLLHPNCRCTTQQHVEGEQKIPVVFGEHAQMVTPEELGQQLGKVVMAEVTDAVRLVLK